MKPVIRFANDHPFMTRSDCGGAPGTNMIPGEGKKLNGNCVDKNTGELKIEKLKFSKLCTILVVIIVKIIFIRSFFFYCLLCNYSFKTKPKSTTNLSQTFQLHCSCVAFLYIFRW